MAETGAMEPGRPETALGINLFYFSPGFQEGQIIVLFHRVVVRIESMGAWHSAWDLVSTGNKLGIITIRVTIAVMLICGTEAGEERAGKRRTGSLHSQNTGPALCLELAVLHLP